MAEHLTSVPGSSAWFERGFVSYSNMAKREMLGVAEDLLEQYGAVSEPVALAMAEGALRHSGADHAISITGIAGPNGGSADKPVGTVCFAWADQRSGITCVATFWFSGDRARIRRQACEIAMQGSLGTFGAQRQG